MAKPGYTQDIEVLVLHCQHKNACIFVQTVKMTRQFAEERPGVQEGERAMDVVQKNKLAFAIILVTALLCFLS